MIAKKLCRIHRTPNTRKDWNMENIEHETSWRCCRDSRQYDETMRLKCIRTS